MWEYTFGLGLKDKIKKKCSLADAKRFQRKAVDIKVDMATRRYNTFKIVNDGSNMAVKNSEKASVFIEIRVQGFSRSLIKSCH